VAALRKAANAHFVALPETSGFTPRYLGHSARSQLAQLASMTRKDTGNRMVAAALESIRTAGFALHPYDYPRLEDILARNAKRIAWLPGLCPHARPVSTHDGRCLAKGRCQCPGIGSGHRRCPATACTIEQLVFNTGVDCGAKRPDEITTGTVKPCASRLLIFCANTHPCKYRLPLQRREVRY
jgi:hypothetical protein